MGDEAMIWKTLVIDDLRSLKSFDNMIATHVTTPEGGIEAIKAGGWSIICFDDHLGYNTDIWPVIYYMHKHRKVIRKMDPICYIIASKDSEAKKIKEALDTIGLLAIIVSEVQRDYLFEYKDLTAL